MRRPLALAGFSLLFSNLLCFLLGTTFAIVAGCVSLGFLLLLFLVFRNNSRLKASLRGCCFFFLCGCLCFTLQFQMQIQPLISLNNTKKFTTFTLLEQQADYGDTVYYTAKATGLYEKDLQKECTLQLVVPATHSLSVGHQYGGVLAFSTQTSSGLQAQGMVLSARYATESAPIDYGHHPSFSYTAYRAREKIKTAILQQTTGDNSYLITGICLGDSGQLSTATQSNFYGVGLGHLLAVSGLHTSQIGGVFLVLFLLLFKRRRWMKLSAVFFVWGFVVLTGASYSALRAAIMFSFFAVGSCVFRKMDSLNTLGGAITCILLIQPFAVGSIGFLASVSACAGLILLATPLTQRVTKRLPAKLQANRWVQYCVQGVCVTLSALIFTISCNFLGFYTLSPVAPLANLLCVPLATLVLIFGLLGGLLSFLPVLGILGNCFIWFAGGISSLIGYLAALLAKIPYHSIPQATPIAFLGMVVFLGICICFWFYPNGMKPLTKGIVLMVLCVGVLCTAYCPAVLPNTQEICVFAEEYNTAMVILSQNHAVLIGDRLPQELQQYLRSRGITTLDLWVLPYVENPTTSLTRIPAVIPIKEIMTLETAESSGLLAGLSTQTKRCFQTTRTIGNITIVAQDTFTDFSIATPNTTLYFAHSQYRQVTNAKVMVYHRKSEYAAEHQLVYDGVAYPLQQTIALRVSPNKYHWYQPHYPFG